MPRNGSGVYSLPAGNPVTTGTTISSTTQNNTTSDLATALTQSIAVDGQTTITANLPMAGFKFTGLSAGAANGDSVRYEQITGVVNQNSASVLINSVAGTNTITGTLTPTLTAYASGQKFTLNPANTNTGATTVNIDSVAAKNLFWNGAACVGGELRQSLPCIIEYDGTQFHIVGNSFNAPFLDTHPIAEGSSDATKKARLEVDGLTTATTRVITVPDRDLTLNNLSAITASLSGDVALNNTGTYFTGPTVAQGTVGTWFASGTVTLQDTAGAASFFVQLTDGTTTFGSTTVNSAGVGAITTASVSGVKANPAGNIRIMVKDVSSTSGKILFNQTSLNLDATVTAIRVG